jgi:LPS-assembly protein
VLEAGEVRVQSGTGRLEAEGGVRLRRGSLTLRTPAAEWDRSSGEVRTRGGVLLAEPGRALEAAEARLAEDGSWEARAVRAWLKDRPLDLAGCGSGEEASRTGRNRATFSGDRLTRRAGEGSLLLEGARITPCDCGGGAPSWEVRARRADVLPGDRAILDWPVLYVTPRFLGVSRLVPVLALPWGYLPLGDRQSGLLFTELRFDRNGTGVGQPVFVTLGRSWDLTATPEWTSGPKASQIATDQRGVRGPGGALELRWAPAEGMAGSARIHVVHSTVDLWPAGAWSPGRNRLSLALRHGQLLGQDGSLALDAALVGDPFYTADFTGDVLLRAAEYRRSAAAAAWRGADLAASAEAAWLQPLVNLDSGRPSAPAPFGLLGGDLPTLHRLPAVALTLLPGRIAGPLRAGGDLRLARFAPARGPGGDEGSDGLGPGDRAWGAAALPVLGGLRPVDASEGDGRWQPGERLAATRALLRAEASAPFSAGGLLLVEPWGAARVAGYAFDAARGPQGAARASGGLALSTELSRAFGEGPKRLFHAVVPRLEWRAGTRGLGAVLPSGYAYDEQDLAPAPPLSFRAYPQRTLSAAPAGAWQQARLAVRNRLFGVGGSASLDLDVGQDLDLLAGRRAESFAALGFRAGPVTLDAATRAYLLGARRPAGLEAPAAASALDRFSELAATLSVGGARGDVHATLLAVGQGGSQRLAAGPEPLLDPRPLPVDAVAQGSAGFRARWSAATLAYDIQFTTRMLAVPVVGGGKLGPHVFQQTARAAWDSPCRCFRVTVNAALPEGQSIPSFHLSLDFSGQPDRRG